jgi:hypothetical protein
MHCFIPKQELLVPAHEFYGMEQYVLTKAIVIIVDDLNCTHSLGSPSPNPITYPSAFAGDI